MSDEIEKHNLLISINERASTISKWLRNINGNLLFVASLLVVIGVMLASIIYRLNVIIELLK